MLSCKIKLFAVAVCAIAIFAVSAQNYAVRGTGGPLDSAKSALPVRQSAVQPEPRQPCREKKWRFSSPEYIRSRTELIRVASNKIIPSLQLKQTNWDTQFSS
jgi:hypothetical protein